MKSIIARLPLLIGVMIAAPSLALAVLQGENLLVPPLQGWSQAATSAGHGIKMFTFVPAGQTADSWSQMTTIEIFDGHSAMKPRDLEQRIVEGFRENCEAMHVTDLGAGTSSSLPAARWVIYCSKFRPLGTGEITYSQAISGEEHFFLVQRSWRGAPFDISKPLPIPETMLKEWEAYFNQVSVCDSRDPKRPCP
jgi:hypothetical protein